MIYYLIRHSPSATLSMGYYLRRADADRLAARINGDRTSASAWVVEAESRLSPKGKERALRDQHGIDLTLGFRRPT